MVVRCHDMRPGHGDHDGEKMQYGVWTDALRPPPSAFNSNTWQPTSIACKPMTAARASLPGARPHNRNNHHNHHHLLMPHTWCRIMCSQFKHTLAHSSTPHIHPGHLPVPVHSLTLHPTACGCLSPLSVALSLRLPLVFSHTHPHTVHGCMLSRTMNCVGSRLAAMGRPHPPASSLQLVAPHAPYVAVAACGR